MLIDKALKPESCAALSFFAYFGINHLFTYHSSIGTISIPVALMNAVILGTSPLLFFYYCRDLFHNLSNSHFFFYNLLVWAYFIYLASVIVIGAFDPHIGYDHQGIDVISKYVTAMVFFVHAFIVGNFMFAVTSWRKVTFLIYCILCLNVFMHLDGQNMSVVLAKDSQYDTNYLFLGDSFAVISLLAFTVTSKQLYKVLIICVSCFCLFVLSSRTSLYAFIFVIGFAFLRDKNLRGPLAIGLVLLVPALFLFKGSIDFQAMGSSRMISFLVSKQDESVSVREKQFKSGLASIEDHWISGDFAGQVSDFGSIGDYMHNFLSVWRQFGLFAFLIFLSLLYQSVALLFSKLKSDFYTSNFIIYLTAFVLIEIIFSRSFMYSYVWYCIGLNSAWLLRRSNVIYRTPLHQQGYV